MEEIWKVIEGYDYPYEISNMGRVKFPNTKTTKAHITNGNVGRYLQVGLYKNKIRKHIGVHQLVALYFLPYTDFNPDGRPLENIEVNHKDENKHNNCVDNLEWCDSKYNNTYGNRIEKATKKYCKSVKCIETGEIFNSTKSAEEKYNLKRGSIKNAANPKNSQKIAGGYHWQYI